MYGQFPPPPTPSEQLTAAEDAVMAWLDTATPFSVATMRQQISIRGMDDTQAAHIRAAAWRKAKA